jgi:thioredoxin 1
MNRLAVNDTTFRGNVRQAGVTLVDFGASWCSPRKVRKPILDELGGQYGESLSVQEVNCDESSSIVTEYGIISIESLLSCYL